MTKNFRAVVVLVCYLLSSYGILSSVFPMVIIANPSFSGLLCYLLTAIAWTCHVIMSVNWVFDRGTEKWVLIWGTGAGTLVLLFWPFSGINDWDFEIQKFVLSIAVRVVLVLPCVVLATYLLRFHIKRDASNEKPTVT